MNWKARLRTQRLGDEDLGMSTERSEAGKMEVEDSRTQGQELGADEWRSRAEG